MEIEIAFAVLKEIIKKQDEYSQLVVNKFEEQIKNKFDFHDESYYQSYIKEDRTIDALIRWQGFSFFLMSFALFESKLKAICRLIKIDFNTTRRNIETCQKFLEENKIEIEINQFKYISNYNFVRNAITHNDGYIKKEKIIEAENLGLKVLHFDNEYLITFQNFSLFTELINVMEKILLNLLFELDLKFKEKNQIS